MFKTSGLHRLLLVFLLLVSTAMTGFSQFQPTKVEISNNTTMTGNRTYYLHEIRQGHTLYSIAKAYGVSQQQILADNPSLVQDGLKIGHVIRILKNKPVDSTLHPDADTTINSQFINHVVEAKESWFSISRNYGVKVSELKNANPGLKWGLPTGIMLRIPKDLIQNRDILIQAEKATEESPVPETDSVVSLKSSEDVASEVIHELSGFKTYKIGILLPLMVPENNDIQLADTVDVDYRFWEFLEGVYLAADSLNQVGYRLELSVFDTEKSGEHVAMLARNGSLNGLDMIIGLVYPSALEVAAGFAKSKGIPLISPLSPRVRFLENNPYVFQVNTPDEQMNQSIAEYLGSDRSYNLVLIAPYLDKGAPDLRNFIDEINGFYSRISFGNRLTVLYYQHTSKTFLDLDSLPASLYKALDPRVQNRVVIPSEDQVFVTDMINTLKKMPPAYDITLFGKAEWTQFSNIDLEYLFDLSFQYAANFSNAFIDYNDPYVINFCRKFLTEWNRDPSRFAFLGYDVTYYFVDALDQISRQVSRSRNDINIESGYFPLMTDFNFHRIGQGNGLLNMAIPIVWYRKETLTREKLNSRQNDQYLESTNFRE